MVAGRYNRWDKEDKKEKKEVSLMKAIELLDTERFLTGFPSLDAALGGGIVVRSIVELFGDESEGKTTLGFQLLGKAQKEGYQVLFVDAEHATTKEYLARFCDLENMYFDLPISAEGVFETIAEFYNRHGSEKNIILVDSVAAMSPLREVDTGSARIAELAAVFSEKLRGTVLSRYTNSIVMFTNQVRTKINLANPGAKSEITPGGKALKFYAGYRLKLDTRQLLFKKQDAESEKETDGKLIDIRVEKNKFGKPFQSSLLRMYFGRGFSREFDTLTYAIDMGIVEKSGSWLTYNGIKEQGESNLMEKLMENDGELFRKLQGEFKFKERSSDNDVQDNQ